MKLRSHIVGASHREQSVFTYLNLTFWRSPKDMIAYYVKQLTRPSAWALP
ncbi:hypothetical protein [uncultured Nostoc sp.]